MKVSLLFLLIAPSLLPADGLSDVRGTLSKLQSDQLLRARVEIKTRNTGGESDKQKQQAEGTSAVIVENGPEGLRLSWSPEQIKQARKAAWEKTLHPDAVKSNLATLAALEANEALNLLDFANPLWRSLEGATLQEDKRDTYQGKPARLLVVRLDLRLNEEARKLMKSADAIVKLWLDEHGVPLGMDRDLQIKLSKFFLTYRVHEHDTRDFAEAGGRLMVTRAVHESFGSGLGHSEESHSNTTVRLLSD